MVGEKEALLERKKGGRPGIWGRKRIIEVRQREKGSSQCARSRGVGKYFGTGGKTSAGHGKKREKKKDQHRGRNKSASSGTERVVEKKKDLWGKPEVVDKRIISMPGGGGYTGTREGGK